VPEIFRVFHSTVSRLARINDSLVSLEVLLSRFNALRQLAQSLREDTQDPEAGKVPAQVCFKHTRTPHPSNLRCMLRER
jgi:hypothetical protein